jgi:hypothetical protein
MKRFQTAASFAVVLSLALAGCSADGVTDASNLRGSFSNSTHSLSVERPWGGSCYVAAEFIGETTLRIIGECHLAHIGRASVLEYQTIVPGPSGIAYTNTAVYTAPNGDELHTTNVGVATPTADGLSLNGIETAVGGTGRFENASGTATLAGSVRFTSASTTIGSYTLDGRLSF